MNANRPLSERVAEIVEEIEMFDDWMDRYQFLVDLGQELEPLKEEERNEQTLIRGCQSQVWLVCESRDGRLYFRGESDAVIVKGIVALLIKVVSGATIEEVANFDFAFVDQVGLREHLSLNRSNGLLAMIKEIKHFAIATIK